VKTAPAWSPDSKRLAIGAAGGYVKDYPLAIVTIDGEVTKPDVQGVGAAWSPDGRWLAFSTEIVRGGSWRHGIPLDGQIGVWELEGRRLTLISQPPMSEHNQEAARWEYSGSSLPVWSPDSRWISYQHVHVVRGEGTDAQRESVWIAGRDGNVRRKVLDHAADVAWTPDAQALIWVDEGRSGRIELGDLPELGDTPARPIGPFSVRGRVTDTEGRPLAGVEIRVARGWGTLRVTEPVQTDEAGRYEVHFGPGMHVFDDPVSLQSALLSARKAGYYEQSLGEQGRLGMAYQRPAAEANADRLFRDVVYPGHPYELNLVMVAAARLV
jgi:dipeptidyl aminopeptidase/acylaminoacyl peptidase